jgi:hypothetical protein
VKAVVSGESGSEHGGRDLDLAPLTKTLQPGVTWHQVSQGETISSIALQYGANSKSCRNSAQVQFSQCDFGTSSAAIPA